MAIVAMPGSTVVAMNSVLPVNQWRRRKIGRKYHSGRATYSTAGSAGAPSSTPPTLHVYAASPSSTSSESATSLSIWLCDQGSRVSVVTSFRCSSGGTEGPCLRLSLKCSASTARPAAGTSSTCSV